MKAFFKRKMLAQNMKSKTLKYMFPILDLLGVLQLLECSNIQLRWISLFPSVIKTFKFMSTQQIYQKKQAVLALKDK